MPTTVHTDGVTLSAAAWANDVDSTAYAVLTGVAGTNTITATGPANYAYAAARTPIYFIPAATNTGATTINITPSGGAALGARNIFHNGAALVGEELRVNVPAALIDDGTQFNLVANAFESKPTLGTAQGTTSGTSIDFTGIPSWAKKITIQFIGVSTSGTDAVLVQLGDSGGVETTDYLGGGTALTDASAVSVVNYTAGFGMPIGGAANVRHGNIVLTLERSANFTWTANGTLALSDSASFGMTAGRKLLSAALDRVRITTTGGTNTFDAGEINILYE